MRQTAGLQPHNWRTGLSAHDVWMAVCALEVMVTRAMRDGDLVTTPSRWLQRLEAVFAALQTTDALMRRADDFTAGALPRCHHWHLSAVQSPSTGDGTPAPFLGN